MAKRRLELFDQATSPEALHAAFQEELHRDGPAGIDRVTPAVFDKQRDDELKKLRQHLLDGTYRCLPILRFHRKKKQGGQRPLGICAVRDRIVQRALLQTLTPVYEQRFLDVSHAYRPRRSPHTALQQLRDWRDDGYIWAYEADIEDCFGSVDADLLSLEIDAVCGDVRMRRLLLRILKSGALEYGIIQHRYLGLPQGSPLSPLLANIYLHPFDQDIVSAGHKLIRFADDLVVMARSEQDAEAAGQAVELALKRRKMRPSPDKTFIRSLEQGIHFLGFHIDTQQQRPHAKALDSIHSRLRDLRGSCARKPPEERIRILTQIIQGWRNYFHGFGDFSPEYPEAQLAAAEVALQRGDVDSLQRFIIPLTHISLPEHQSRLDALRQQAGFIPADPHPNDESIAPFTDLPLAQPHEPFHAPQWNALPYDDLSIIDPQTQPPINNPALADHTMPSAQEFSRSLRQIPPSPSFQRIAPVLSQTDDVDISKSSYGDAIATLRHNIHLDPHHTDNYTKLAEVYQRSGQFALARGVLQSLQELQTLPPEEFASVPTPPPPSRLLPTPLTPVPATSQESNTALPHKPSWWCAPDSPPTPSSAPPVDAISLSAEARERYLKFFQGRRGILARAVVQPDGRLYYQPIARHFGESCLQEILDGQATYAIFPIHEDDQTWLAGIDIDLTKRVVEAHLDHPDTFQERVSETHTWALTITHALEQMGISSLLEDSGFKGRHIWIFLSHPMSARRLRSFFRSVLRTLPSAPPGIRAELFPDRDSLIPHDPGQPIKLPLCCHPRTGQRTRLLHPKTGGLLSPDEAIARIEPVDPQRLEDWLLEQNVRDKLEDLEQRYPTCHKLLQRCLILRHLFEKAQAVRHLQHVERVSLLYSFGHLGEEGIHFLHAIIGLCYDYDPAITAKYIEKRRGFAISCPRLREKHGDLLSGAPCQCFFQKIPHDGYPTPLLHVMTGKQIFSDDLLKPKSPPRSPTKTKKQLPPSSTQHTTDTAQEQEQELCPLDLTINPDDITDHPDESSSTLEIVNHDDSHTENTQPRSPLSTPDVSTHSAPETLHSPPPQPSLPLDDLHPRAPEGTKRTRSSNVSPEKPPQTQPPSPAQQRDRLHELMRHYVEFKRNIRGLERTLERTSQEMAEIFDQRNTDQIETSMGLLVRVKNPDGSWSWKLEF